MTDPQDFTVDATAKATAIAANGVRVHDFDNGSTMVAVGDQAMHFTPTQAETLRHFIRVFDQRKEPPSVLSEANTVIHGDRASAYGPPEQSIDRIRGMWSAIFGHEVSRTQFCLAMIALKISRETNAHKRDNLVDICGYAALLEKVLPK